MSKYCAECGKESPVSPCVECQTKALEEADRLGREALEQAQKLMEEEFKDDRKN